MKGLTFGKTILLVIGAAAFALVSCLGALGGGSEGAFVAGGALFAIGTLTTVFGLLRLFYLSVLWLVSLTSKPPQNPSA